MRYEDENIWLTQKMMAELYKCRCTNRQLPHRQGVRGGCGLDEEFRLQPRFLYQIFHHELGHWAAADVSMADEKYLDKHP